MPSLPNPLPPGVVLLTSDPRARVFAQEPERSFEQRLAGARGALESYARRLSPPGQGQAGSHRDHEDLVQDTLARALSKQSSFDARKPMLPWLKRMLLRVFLNHRSRVLASPEGRSSDAIEELVEAAPVGESAHELTEQAEQLLARLDEPERSILDRFHRQGESIAQIARGLALPVGTVKSHLHRARLRLRGQSNPHNPAAGGRS
ncbi:MAG: RNA polymerase sigma factor [bacterium]|nr:RNA polymerase sigma factor [bacterium]